MLAEHPGRARQAVAGVAPYPIPPEHILNVTNTFVAIADAIRTGVAKGLQSIDSYFEARFRAARDKGELPPDADPSALAVLASATMHSIAVRARAGARRAELKEIARKAVKVMCGT